MQQQVVAEPTGPLTPSATLRLLHARWPDVLGVLWVAAAGIAVLVPALLHGLHLGPFDILSQSGLSKQPGVVVNNPATQDQIDAINPWTTLAWTQVHHGQLPLWNPYGGLGMPLAFNVQSAPFGLPALVGYLAPVQFAFTVGVAITLIVAGTGTYVLGRVLHLGVMGSAMAATVFELSGPFIGWLGWPLSSAMSWTGWLFAAALLIVRGKRRTQSVAFFAVVLAFACYAGQPEILLLLLFALFLFLVVLLAQTAWLERGVSIWRPAMDLVLAVAAGGALAAPLLLPGFQFTSASARNNLPVQPGLPIRNLLYLIFQGYDGLQVSGSQWFGSPFGYPETAAYVGVIALVLAGAAIALRHQRREVIAFSAVVIATIGIIFVPSLTSFMSRLPVVGVLSWHRALFSLAFAIAVLAGFGLDAIVREDREKVWRWTGIGFAVTGGVLVMLAVTTVGHLPAVQNEIREKSFFWPVAETVVGLGTVALVLNRGRHSHHATANTGPATDQLLRRPSSHSAPPIAPVPSGVNDGSRETEAGGRLRLGPKQLGALVLLACETAFLVSAGAPLWSSSPHFYSPTQAEVMLQRFVGSSTVGVAAASPVVNERGIVLAGPSCYMGILPNVNDVYAVHELNIYDPAIPTAYYSTWDALTGQRIPLDSYNFCPLVKTTAIARRYGVTFVLQPRGSPGLKGAVFVTRVGDEALYRVPGAATATVTSIGLSKALPPTDAPGRGVVVTHPDPASWRMVTRSATPQVLRLRLTDVPGWHGSIDGKPLALEKFSGMMLQARIPKGRHVVELQYWPDTLNVGLVLAVCSVTGLSIALAVGRIRRRRRRNITCLPR